MPVLGDPMSSDQLRKLQAELLAEEMKLALMKQVRQSQSQHGIAKESPSSSTAGGLVHSQSHTQPTRAGSREIVPTPPPSLREIRPSHDHHATSSMHFRVSRLPNPGTHAHSDGHGGRRESTLNVAKPHVGRTNSDPFVATGTREGYFSKFKVSNLGDVQTTPVPSSSSRSSAIQAKTEASLVWSAAFESHRKKVQRIAVMQHDLDSFLETIRPTLPPQYSWALIPSSSSDHFRSMLGLEECVRELEAEQLRAQGVKIAGDFGALPDVVKPFCRHCQTDYAPFWRSFTNEKKEMVVVCEQCDWLRLKYPLVQQHGLLLKDAFAQAENQENEVARLEKQCKEEEEQLKKDWQMLHNS